MQEQLSARCMDNEHPYPPKHSTQQQAGNSCFGSPVAVIVPAIWLHLPCRKHHMKDVTYKGSHQSMGSMLSDSSPCSIVHLYHMQSQWKACLDVLAQQIEAHTLRKEDVMLQGLVCRRSIDSIWPKALSYHDRCCWSGPRIWLKPYDRHTCITPTSPTKSRFVS